MANLWKEIRKKKERKEKWKKEWKNGGYYTQTTNEKEFTLVGLVICYYRLTNTSTRPPGSRPWLRQKMSGRPLHRRWHLAKWVGVEICPLFVVWLDSKTKCCFLKSILKKNKKNCNDFCFPKKCFTYKSKCRTGLEFQREKNDAFKNMLLTTKVEFWTISSLILLSFFQLLLKYFFNVI